mmetsp:Transcript_11507/g.21118  ORF Transcript_11507/g.21118 Transcript_11507/m.21118 type:complete len:83 (+) Transcript_11507:1-249(+)
MAWQQKEKQTFGDVCPRKTLWICSLALGSTWQRQVPACMQAILPLGSDRDGQYRYCGVPQTWLRLPTAPQHDACPPKADGST